MERRVFYLDTSIWSFAFADDAPDYRAARFVAVKTHFGYTKGLVICNPLEVYEV